jgi:hypothetical protein
LRGQRGFGAGRQDRALFGFLLTFGRPGNHGPEIHGGRRSYHRLPGMDGVVLRWRSAGRRQEASDGKVTAERFDRAEQLIPHGAGEGVGRAETEEH